MTAARAPVVAQRAVLVWSAAVAGCGYTAGYGLGAAGVHTVAVHVAGNETYRERLAIPLTTQLYRVLPSHANVAIASDDRADAVLDVTIEHVHGRSLVPGVLDPLREGALHFGVHVVLRDRRTGAVIRDRRIEEVAEYRSPIGETEASAIAEASYDLARKIALALEPSF